MNPARTPYTREQKQRISDSVRRALALKPRIPRGPNRPTHRLATMTDADWELEQRAIHLAAQHGRSWDRLPYDDRERFRSQARTSS